MKTRLKTKLHFNRVNMVRRNPNVWTAHNSLVHDDKLLRLEAPTGKVLAETVYDPKAKQPRAYFIVQGKVKYRGKKAIIEV